jgi:hypothetical protein
VLPHEGAAAPAHRGARGGVLGRGHVSHHHLCQCWGG